MYRKYLFQGGRIHNQWIKQPNKFLTSSCSIVFSVPAFQRFAVRTSKRIEEISSKAVQKRQELAEQVKDLSKNFEAIATMFDSQELYTSFELSLVLSCCYDDNADVIF
ncbi:hypothetical protein Acr_03g0005630 [Actinidia rufa]|uniref:Uncharacterized protein n=1 Tax=Actinidia rufa TaxID=165716 RepID=A0A7J0ED50_9ERIC|nr:hypothetical protein Acr_03g0005630 [Actinidia rufa]